MGYVFCEFSICHFDLQHFVLLAPHWYCWPKEKNPLANNPEMTDLPIDAGSWLLYFRNMNQKSLSLTNVS